MAIISRHECLRTGKVTYESKISESYWSAVRFTVASLFTIALVVACAATITIYRFLASIVACACFVNLAMSMAAVSRESLTVIRDMGILVEGFSWCGIRTEQTFVELQRIASVFIHEGMTSHDIR